MSQYFFDSAYHCGPGDQVLTSNDSRISTYTATTDREIQFGLRLMLPSMWAGTADGYEL